MKKILPIVFTLSLCFFISHSISAQSKGKITSDAGFSEKIYLDVASTIVTTDDGVWFKCLVTDADQIPTQLSKILHVELIDFDEHIIDSKLLKIEKGLSSGFFNLNEKLSSGRYQLRAYTEWNKNFGDDFISTVYVDIYKPKEVKENQQVIRSVVLSESISGEKILSAKAYPSLLNSKYKGKLKMYIHTEDKTDSVVVKKEEDNGYNLNYVLPKNTINARIEFQLDSVRVRNFDYKKFNSYSKTIVIDKNYFDLQFFAEGGKLVNGLASKLAFKALDYNGKGKEVTGTIVDDKNDIIRSFASNSLGMGFVEFTPDISKTYHAEIVGQDNVVYKYILPNIVKEGLVLQVKEEGSFIDLTINTNQKDLQEVYVKTMSKGVNCGSFFLDFIDGKANKKIDKKRYPEGIVKIQIFGKQANIIAERLFFNYKEENRLSLKTSLTKNIYKQREKTTININTKDKNKDPLTTNLSVLVINKALLGTSKNKQNSILSYFLLNSELKGNIESPNYYFDKKNKDRRAAMDVLLLTQGFKNYKYESPLSTEKFEFLPENGLSISGKATSIWGKEKPLNKGIELTILYGPMKVLTQQVKFDGSFNFKLNDYEKEKFKIIFQSKDKKGKKKEIKINLDTYKIPEITYEKQEQVYLPDSTFVNIVKQSEKVKEAEIAFKIAEGTIELDEIELTGYNMTPARQKMKDKYGLPDLVIEGEELLKKAPKWHYGINSIIWSSFFDDIKVISRYDCIRYRLDGFPLTTASGRPIIFVDDIPIEEIKSYEVIFKPTFNGSEIRDIQRDTCQRLAIISIYSYTGKGPNYIRKNRGIDTFYTQGFAPKVEFYTPKYENTNEYNWNIPDLRSVVYWNPNLETDKEGNAKVEYYNGDNTEEMLIIVEGITKNGKIGYDEISYQVEEK